MIFGGNAEPATYTVGNARRRTGVSDCPAGRVSARHKHSHSRVDHLRKAPGPEFCDCDCDEYDREELNVDCRACWKANCDCDRNGWALPALLPANRRDVELKCDEALETHVVLVLRDMAVLLIRRWSREVVCVMDERVKSCGIVKRAHDAPGHPGPAIGFEAVMNR